MMCESRVGVGSTKHSRLSLIYDMLDLLSQQDYAYVARWSSTRRLRIVPLLSSGPEQYRLEEACSQVWIIAQHDDAISDLIQDSLVQILDFPRLLTPT